MKLVTCTVCAGKFESEEEEICSHCKERADIEEATDEPTGESADEEAPGE